MTSTRHLNLESSLSSINKDRHHEKGSSITGIWFWERGFPFTQPNPYLEPAGRGKGPRDIPSVSGSTLSSSPDGLDDVSKIWVACSNWESLLSSCREETLMMEGRFSARLVGWMNQWVSAWLGKWETGGWMETEWMEEWVSRQVDRWIGKWADRWTCGWVGIWRWTNRWVDVWMYGEPEGGGFVILRPLTTWGSSWEPGSFPSCTVKGLNTRREEKGKKTG